MRWIREYREKQRLSQEDLVAQLQVRGIEITRASVSHWETGKARPPLENSQFVHALADILRIDVQTVLRLSGYELNSRHSEEAERIAQIVDRLAARDRLRMLRIAESFLEV